MQINGKAYRTIWFENNIVKIIDQTKLPHQFIIKDLKTVKDSINAIFNHSCFLAIVIGIINTSGGTGNIKLSIKEKKPKKNFEFLCPANFIDFK